MRRLLSIPAVLLILLLATAALYVPFLGDSLVGLDVGVYSQALFHDRLFDAAVRVLYDFRGEVISGYYAPLSSLSLMLDRHLVMASQPVPMVTLLVNLLLHLTNGCLIYLLLKRFRMPAFVTLFTVGIFLIHPLQVSSVLWFAERKTLLCQFFCLATYILYVDCRLERSSARYWFSLITFVGSLLSKPTAVTFPVLLLITEIVGYSRLSGRRDESASPFNDHMISGPAPLPGPLHVASFWTDRATRSVIARLAPFFVLAGVWGLLVLHTEPTQGWLPVQNRPFIAAGAILFYVSKFILPLKLMFIYPFWNVDPASLAWWLVALGLIVLCGLIYALRKHISGGVAWGLANFLVPLFPCLGFFEFGTLQHAFVANHFLYPSLMGLAVVLAFAMHAALTSIRQPLKYGAVGLIIAYSLFLPVQALSEIRTWQNSYTLWSETLKRNPLSWMAHYQMGLELMGSRNFQKADEHFKRCMELQADYPYAFYMRGQALLEMGKPAEAIDSYRQAIKLDPRFPDSYNDIGIALSKLGRKSEALEHYSTAVRLAPDRAEFHVNMGMTLLQSDRPAEAIPYLQRAIAINPDIPLAHELLSRAIGLCRDRRNLNGSDGPQVVR